MLGIRIELDGDVQLHRSISRFVDNIQDLSPVWGEVRDEFWEIERELFDSEGSSGASGGWAPLSPRYARWKAQHYPGARIMHRHGVLEESLTGPGSGSIVRMRPQELALGSSVRYAGYHQRGTGRMPARKVIDLAGASKTRIMKIIQRWLVNRHKELLS